MLRHLTAVSSLLLGFGTLLIGAGLLSTLLPVRGHMEGFSELQIGIVMACYYVGFVAGTALCPWMVRRVGHIRAFAALAAITIVSILAYTLVVSAVVWAILRAAVGVGMIGLYITVESWLNERADRQTRGRILATYEMVALGALALGQFFITVGELRSAQPFMLAAGLFALGVIPVALTRLPEPKPGGNERLRLNALFRVSPLAVVGTLIGGFGAGSFFSMGPLHAQQLGLEPAGIAAYMSAALFGGAMVQWPVGWLSDRIDRRLIICATTLSAAAAGLGLLALASRGFPVLIACVFLYGGTVTVIYALCVAHANDQLPQAQYLDAARGFNFLYAVGAASAPVVTGALMARFGAAGLFVTSAVVLLGLGLYAVRTIARGPVVIVETRDKFVPVATISPCEPEMHPHEPLEEDRARATDVG